MATEITDSNFDEITKKAGKPVVIDFWAQWCGPCLNLAPTIEELAKEYADTVLICKVNVDDNPKLSEQFKIRSIPAIHFFDKDMNSKDIVVGLKSKQELIKSIDKLKNS